MRLSLPAKQMAEEQVEPQAQATEYTGILKESVSLQGTEAGGDQIDDYKISIEPAEEEGYVYINFGDFTIPDSSWNLIHRCPGESQG